MAVILAALGSGLFYLIRGKSSSKSTVKSLTVRIVVSISLFIFLLMAYALGWIHPHGIYTLHT
ncbi:MAG: twin transmembrane helix small protein [Gammaproteobacteria bacterium]